MTGEFSGLPEKELIAMIAFQEAARLASAQSNTIEIESNGSTVNVRPVTQTPKMK